MQLTDIHIKDIDTPLGSMRACATEQGILSLLFTDEEIQAGQQDMAQARGINEHLEELKQQLNEYFNGDRKVFTVKLCPQGSDFQQSVWTSLQGIPYGRTISYKEQSTALGKPEAIRAVARANGTNPIAIVIPCHRVIGSNGKLTGYAGGVWRKNYLLELEQTHSMQTLLFTFAYQQNKPV